MKITSVNVKKMENEESKMKAVATVVLDDCIAIHDIKIISGKNEDGSEKLFIAMPSRKLPNGSYRDVAHPINQETRDIFEEAILAEYNKVEE